MLNTNNVVNVNVNVGVGGNMLGMELSQGQDKAKP